MKRIITFSFIVLFVIVSSPKYLFAGEGKEVSLPGRYVGTEGNESALKDEDPGETEASKSAPACKDLPIIANKLEEEAAGMNPSDRIRVIIYLKYHPQALIAKDIQDAHSKELRAIKKEIKAVNSRYVQMRNPEAECDGENYRDAALKMTPAELTALQRAADKYEALSLKMKKELFHALSAELKGSQKSVQDSIERLGGEVEFGALSTNALVAKVPVCALETIAALDGIAHIAGDATMEAHLDNACSATKINTTDGLWWNEFFGGNFDPAVMDTGTTLEHPALADSTERTNFYSWYLEAGQNSPEWDDELDIVDRNHHGTHVLGIVASRGTSEEKPGGGDYTNHLGMAYGVEKTVTLKAGFNKTGYHDAGMKETDAMYLVDRALFDSDELQPYGTFIDDIDGLNLSYGGRTDDDENSYSRFWDSVVATYPDLLVTISAGNTGEDYENLGTPACAYNNITVASVNDHNTWYRSDDTIMNRSSRGPTLNGRRKPDIAAPGVNIESCNFRWEGWPTDFFEKSGTSMAAPMVLGVGMCLMDAGVTDELEIKALLLNTAQKNDGEIDFEDDADGWDPAYGWGYMNAKAAYYHRSDVITATVTEKPNPGYYRLFKGTMRDESSGEGRDRVTMVWNRHATYNPHHYPETYYDLSNLNLRLYNESDNDIINSDLAYDNVHQVRIRPGAWNVDVVVKAYAEDTDFPHGGDTETFALATEEDFEEVDFPSIFNATADYPSVMEPNEIRDITFRLTNNSEIASHNNLIQLLLPSGWTLLSGSNILDEGSLEGEGGGTADIVWTVQAPPTEQGVNFIRVQHTHYSYGEFWGPYEHFMVINVQNDTTPPTPNPMTFITEPFGRAVNQIRMYATTADDDHLPVEYYVNFVDSPTGGSGGSSSGWQEGTLFTDSSLWANHQYGYRVKARDNSVARNETVYSDVKYAYTMARNPDAPKVNNPTYTTLDVTINPNGNPEWTEFAIHISWGAVKGYYLNSSGGSNGLFPRWYTLDEWGGTVTAIGLESNTEYEFAVVARNGDEVWTNWSDKATGRTLRREPVPDIKANDSDGLLKVTKDDTVRIILKLDAGDYAGITSDWWVFVESRFGTFSYVHPIGWKPGMRRMALYPLFNVGKAKLFAGPLPLGSHTFHFAVDNNGDNVPDLTWMDSVEVLVSK